MNCATPQQIRSGIESNLIKIATSNEFNTGIGSTLSKMRNVLNALVKTPPKHDDTTDFNDCWNVVQLQLLEMLTKGARAHCHDKTVFSTTTSLRTGCSAGNLRKWIEKEFKTEVDFVLETPGIITDSALSMTCTW